MAKSGAAAPAPGEELTLNNEKLITGVRSYASARLFSQVASWLGTIYVIRHLGSHAVGEYGFTVSVLSYLSMVFDGTMLEAFVQRPPATERERRGAFTLLSLTGLAAAVAMLALATVVTRIVADRTVADLMAAAASILVLTSLCVLPHATLAHEMNFSRLARIAAAQSICVTTVSVLLAYLGYGAWALVAGAIASALTRAVLLNITRPQLVRPTLDIAPAIAYFKTGAVLLADNALLRWYTSLDTFLLGHWAGTAALGFYSLGQQTSELPLEKIANVVNEISLPAYARSQDDPDSGSRLMLETIRTHATIGFPLFWGIAVVAPYFVRVIFGPSWGPAIVPIAALAAVAPLRLMGSIETPAMTGIGRVPVLLKSKAIIVPFMSLALFVGCLYGNINGAALAWLIAFPLCYGLAFRWVLSAMRLGYRQLITAIRGPASAALLMVIAVLVARSALLYFTNSPVAILSSEIAVGVLAYTLALRLVDPRTYFLGKARILALVNAPAGETQTC